MGYLEYLALVLVAYVPQLWARPGLVDADIKTYLYLDPGRFLRQSVSMWDPGVGARHRHPRADRLPVARRPVLPRGARPGHPDLGGRAAVDGVAAARGGAGVLYLCRTLGLDRPGRTVAAFAYMLSPYFLQDVGRISSPLLPWAGLGWLLAFTIKAVRDGVRRFPALFALVWLSISALNASGPVHAAVAPALWLLYAVFVSKEYPLGRAWAATWRIVVLTGAVSLWWAWSLLIEGHYGLNILGYTETVAAVAKTSTAAEILRGLGYWFFYGADSAVRGRPADRFHPGAVVGGAHLHRAAAGPGRRRLRALASPRHFVFLIVVGLVLAVGSHPYAGPSGWGRSSSPS